ncbi:MAG: fibrobacter succinogenes major paralogous domain-containing protein [Bacteroidales bacterium]|jgi:uncharacterized protein (TIGR02145 family)|nr:fibrobacter succinogenes major paralogous domain-containing protein [Bacteroidales bacterium]
MLYKFVFITLLCLLVFAQQESSVSPQESLPVTGTFTDPRDGQVYRTVKIGNLTWMAENLNFEAKGSVCYGEDGQVAVRDEETRELSFSTLSNVEIQANCAKYGRLYDWATVMGLPSICDSSFCVSQIQTPHHQGICPVGWHVPNATEWEALVNHAGGSSTARNRLRSREGWHSDCHLGTDDYAFSALPGGYRISRYDPYDHAGDDGGWWSATEASTRSAWHRIILCRNDVVKRTHGKESMFSLRCVRQ